MPGLENSGSNQKSSQRNGGENNGSGRKWYRSKSGNNATTKSKTTNNQLRARELKFRMHGTESSKKAETFKKIKDDIVSRIKRTFINAMDIAKSIQNNARITHGEPEMGETTETDAAKLAREDKKITLKYQIDYEQWIKEEKSFKENWVKAYAMILDQYCAKDVQVALKEQSDFETAVMNEPLVLLERIKLLVHTPEKAKYPLLTLIEAMASILNFRQGKNEDLLSYLSRYKLERDVLLTLFGDSFLDGYTI